MRTSVSSESLHRLVKSSAADLPLPVPLRTDRNVFLCRGQRERCAAIRIRHPILRKGRGSYLSFGAAGPAGTGTPPVVWGSRGAPGRVRHAAGRRTSAPRRLWYGGGEDREARNRVVRMAQIPAGHGPGPVGLQQHGRGAEDVAGRPAAARRRSPPSAPIARGRRSAAGTPGFSPRPRGRRAAGWCGVVPGVAAGVGAASAPSRSKCVLSRSTIVIRSAVPGEQMTGPEKPCRERADLRWPWDRLVMGRSALSRC